MSHVDMDPLDLSSIFHCEFMAWISFKLKYTYENGIKIFMLFTQKKYHKFSKVKEKNLILLTFKLHFIYLFTFYFLNFHDPIKFLRILIRNEKYIHLTIFLWHFHLSLSHCIELLKDMQILKTFEWT